MARRGRFFRPPPLVRLASPGSACGSGAAIGPSESTSDGGTSDTTLEAMSLPGGGGNGGTSDTTLVGLDAAPPCSSGFEPRIDPIESSVLSAGAAAGVGAIPLLPPPPPVRVGVSTSWRAEEERTEFAQKRLSRIGPDQKEPDPGPPPVLFSSP